MTQNAPHIDAQTFVEHLVRSGLLEPEAMARFNAEGPETEDGLELARFLVRKGMLTKFQAERLLSGRSDGFQLGQYRILDELGRGGMGRVYKALHLTMGRIVALKVLAPNLTKTDMARELFRREVRAAAKLNHPNIVAAFDANQAGESCFLVMEFVDGPNLSELVKRRGPLPTDQSCEFIRQTATGLANAHAMGLIHRDIKPANLLVQTTAAGPVIKILDFGLAHIVAPDKPSDLSDANGEFMVMGTPDYVSPEQARNKSSVDVRSDLYSLGCTFYYLLTGAVPFPGGSALEKIVRHYSDEPTDIRTLRPEIPEQLAVIVHRLLAKKPDERFADAHDLINALNRLALAHSDWQPPSTDNSKRDSGLNVGVREDDPWANLADDSIANTLPNVGSATRETSTSRPSRFVKSDRERHRRGKMNWVWIGLLIVCVISVFLGVVSALKFFIAHQ
ncbi:serine/threonine-protein kinase [Zavarzinella formosa]|uniref:serine/threonine-protein kinase n=1 Tax=Zavarzinella formosa TaxID=360055 RepID=UPI0003088E41|nr:serine/threonine-protein kinase [Zavarzinella formosa]